MPATINEIGNKYNHLTVIRRGVISFSGSERAEIEEVFGFVSLSDVEKNLSVLELHYEKIHLYLIVLLAKRLDNDTVN